MILQISIEKNENLKGCYCLLLTKTLKNEMLKKWEKIIELEPVHETKLS